VTVCAPILPEKIIKERELLMELKSSTLMILCCLFAFSATADTRDVKTTAYSVTTEQGTPVTTPQGTQVVLGLQSHAYLVDHVTDEHFSQWCTGQASEFGQVGHCTVIADNGDVLWISYISQGDTGTWSVIGGTGQYMGATGGGTNAGGSQRGDGQAWTFESEGTLTTK
jgi:hypothetical protein